MDKELAQQSLARWQNAAEMVNESITHKQVELKNTFDQSIALISGLEQVVATFAALYLAGAIFAMTRLREIEKDSPIQSIKTTNMIKGLPIASAWVMGLSFIAILADSIMIYVMPLTGLNIAHFILFVVINILPFVVICYSVYYNLRL